MPLESYQRSFVKGQPCLQLSPLSLLVGEERIFSLEIKHSKG